MKIIKAIWRVICYPLLIVAVQAVIGAAYGIVFGLPIAFKMVSEGQDLSQEAITQAITEKMDLSVIALISFGVTLFILWLALRKEWKRAAFWSGAGLRGIVIAMCLLLGVSMNLVSDGAVYFTKLTEYFPDYEQLMNMIVGNNLVLEILSVALLGPIVEEVVFRGTILRRLKSGGMNIVLAILIQALLFSLVHGNVVQGLYAFVLGAVLGLIYVWFDSIWPVITMHVAYNSFSVIMSSSSIEGAEISDPVFAALSIVALALSVGLIILLGKNKNHKNAAAL